MKRLIKKLLLGLKPNVSEDRIVNASIDFNVTPDYLRSEFIIEKAIYRPTFYVRFDVIED
jgi:hypothetical protein